MEYWTFHGQSPTDFDWYFSPSEPEIRTIKTIDRIIRTSPTNEAETREIKKIRDFTYTELYRCVFITTIPRRKFQRNGNYIYLQHHSYEQDPYEDVTGCEKEHDGVRRLRIVSKVWRQGEKRSVE